MRALMLGAALAAALLAAGCSGAQSSLPPQPQTRIDNTPSIVAAPASDTGANE